MDPEVQSSEPGACPKCGMALEPRTVSALDTANPELVDMTRRFRIAAVLAAPVFVVTMADMVGGGRLAMAHGPLVNWVGLVLATPTAFRAGCTFFERAWAWLRNR